MTLVESAPRTGDSVLTRPTRPVPPPPRVPSSPLVRPRLDREPVFAPDDVPLGAERTGWFTAMVVGADPYRRAMAVRRLRSLGARDVTEAGTVLQARAWARTAGPRDVCLAEAALPDGSGILLLAELQRAGWTGCAVVPLADGARAARAALAARVRSCVLAGRVTGVGPDSDAARAASRLGLSAREVEVLRHVAEGRSNRDIGEAMGLSALTVKSHLARIARKLGTGDRAGMVATAIRARAID
jgi:DNA-binding NarL/FixJ family response regulator